MVAPIHHQVVVYATIRIGSPASGLRRWATSSRTTSRSSGPLLEAGVAQESDTVVIDGRRFWREVRRHPPSRRPGRLERTGIVRRPDPVRAPVDREGRREPRSTST